jgi:transposase
MTGTHSHRHAYHGRLHTKELERKGAWAHEHRHSRAGVCVAVSLLLRAPAASVPRLRSHHRSTEQPHSYLPRLSAHTRTRCTRSGIRSSCTTATAVAASRTAVRHARPPGDHGRVPVMQRSAIVVLHKQGCTRQEIGQQAGVSQPTVRHWVQHYEEHKDVTEEKHGRPRCTDEALDTAIAFTSHVEPFTPPRGIKRKHDLDISSRTIDRRLKEAGLYGRVARHLVTFTAEHKQKRLAFAERYKGWTEAQWESVLFSDETIFTGAGFSGQRWVRRHPGEALLEANTVDKKSHPVKVNVWGCFCAAGVGYTYIFNENMNAKLLKKIFNDGHLLESAEDRGLMEPLGRQWWFLQDNDGHPKHKSREVQTWLHNKGIACIDFPPYSPDLNPIEHLWADLARRIEEHQDTTMKQLQDRVEAEWQATSVEFLRELVHSMPARCQAVIDAEGGHTKY